MNHWIKLIALMTIIPFLPLAADWETSLEARYATFYHTSPLFRKIYGNINHSYEVEAAIRTDNCPVSGWFNIDYSAPNGRAIGFDAKTSIQTYNYSLGLSVSYPLCEKVICYTGAGPNFSTTILRNKSPITNEKIFKYSTGAVFKLGIHYFFTDRLFLDIFTDYLLQSVKYEKRVDIGGFKFGIGVGIKFE